MIIQKATSWLSNTADIAQYRLLKADSTNGFPYCLHSSARASYVFAVSLAAAESDHKEQVQLEPLTPGCVISVYAGEAIAIGELVCPGVAGVAMDADTSGDVVIGTAVTAAAAVGDIIQVVIDNNFGAVVA